jgi:hypothetical protein
MKTHMTPPTVTVIRKNITIDCMAFPASGV